jgi:hypothetical protein
VPAAKIAGSILLNQRVNSGRIAAREDVPKQIDQMPADVALEEFESHRTAIGGKENLLDRAANVRSGIQQGAVNVKQVNRKRWDRRSHLVVCHSFNSADHAG